MANRSPPERALEVRLLSGLPPLLFFLKSGGAKTVLEDVGYLFPKSQEFGEDFLPRVDRGRHRILRDPAEGGGFLIIQNVPPPIIPLAVFLRL